MIRAALTAALVLQIAAAGGAATRPRADGCGAGCRAAYAAIARALPGDRTNSLARAILATPSFDHRELARALGIPTPAQVRAQWRRSCERRFAGDRDAVLACDRLIVGWPAPPGASS